VLASALLRSTRACVPSASCLALCSDVGCEPVGGAPIAGDWAYAPGSVYMPCLQCMHTILGSPVSAEHMLQSTCCRARALTAAPRARRAGGGCLASRRPQWCGGGWLLTQASPATAARAAPARRGASGGPPRGSLRLRGPGLWLGRLRRVGARAGGCWPRLATRTASPRQGRPRSLPGGAAGRRGSWRRRRRCAAPGSTAEGLGTRGRVCA